MGYIMDLRAFVGHRPLIQVGSSVIVEDGQGQILLQLRTDNHQWSFSAAGSMEPGESPEDTARRELLEETGVSAEVVGLHRIAPLDAELVAESVRRTGRLLVLEDCNENGSIGQQLASALVQAGAAPRKMVLKNLKNAFAPQGSVAQLRKRLGLDAGSVAEAVQEML